MVERPTVIVAPFRRRMSEIFAPEDLERLHATVDVFWGKDDPLTIDEAGQALPNAVAIVGTNWPLGEVLDRAVKLRAILDVSGGFPREIDYDKCLARGIRILTAAPAFGPQVAEMALGMALAASREIVAGDSAMREGNERWLHAGNETTFLLYGKPVGFIGFGSLGRSLRPLLAPFGCKIGVFDPWLSDGYIRSQGLVPLELIDLLTSSKVIFVLAVPTAENQALLTRDLLERIQPGSVLVLISRAHVVDFDALTELVQAGRFKAAIDVFPTEPLPADHSIRQASGTVLSAHRAGSVPEGLVEIGRMVVDDLEAIARSLPPQRLQVAQPELFGRYVRIAAPPPKAKG
ncbi:MAG TPA: NAD(P)-dependent oxidoreductase [Chloroflexota bacterium]|nr:NAD(P)-dependent oxidoreductase [Chloroflexota bacterium]